MTNRFRRALVRARNSLAYRTGLRLPLPPVSLPADPVRLKESDLFQSHWYYTVELLPGVIARGIYPDTLPLLPRVLLRNCRLEGADCLDIGTMEGLMPVLMRRRGARRVLAVDAVEHCVEKLTAVRHYHGAEFDYKSVGLMYDLDRKLPGEGFDLINLSGLLYHVFSPLMVLCGVRPLLKRGGLLIVSTNVLLEDGFAAEFNAGGRMQEEANTFWYLAVPLLDYMLRYLKLAPLDCRHLRHAELGETPARLTFDRPSGYLSVICRAVDDVLPAAGDEWMRASAASSWEYRGLVRRAAARPPPRAVAAYAGARAPRFMRRETESLDLWAAVNGTRPLNAAARTQDAHVLLLSDRE
ncbi:MAG TPA: methyltransferase domain-containing protein [Pyrinomonadaceae bacterium]